MRSAGQGVMMMSIADAESDEAMGVGQPDEHDETAWVAKTIADPRIAALIEAIVDRRLQMMGTPPSTADGLNAVVSGIERLVQMNAAQLPGYSKPLPAAVVAEREAAFVEMNALLAECEHGEKPRYRLVGEPLFAGEILYPEGSTIETLVYPNEHMAPLNEPARLVHAAMMRWIGGPQKGIAERVEEAEREARNNGNFDATPFRRAGLPEASPVTVVAPPEDVRAFDPRRPPQAAHELADQGVVHRI